MLRISACGKAGAWEHAWQCFCDLPEMRLERNLGLNLWLFKEGWMEAKQTQNTWYDNCALQTAGDFQSCIRYFEHVFSWIQSGQCSCSKCVPSDFAMLRNTITFNSMIDAFDKGGEWKRAVWLLEQDLRGNLSEKSGLVDVIGFNAAISACEEAAKWEEALELLKQLQGALQADVTLVLGVLSKSRFFWVVYFWLSKVLCVCYQNASFGLDDSC